MPLANNSTGAGAGDNYNSSNPAMVAGILSPTDGDVYVYGYDDNRQQVIIRKVPKTAQVPHKGMTAHPVYTNNLLSTYIKNSVIPTTVGAMHTPQAVVPTTNNFLSTYQKNAAIPTTVGAMHTPQAVVPTTNNFLSTYQKNGVTPTVTDFLSSYVKNAVIPVAGKFGEMGSDGKYVTNRTLALRAERVSANFKPVGALHGKAGITPRETVDGKEVMPLTKMRLDGLANNPVSGSWTHALHGVTKDMLSGYQKNPVIPVAGSNPMVNGRLPLTVQRLNALANNPVTGSWTHALHGVAGSNPRESYNGKDNLLPLTVQKLSALANNPVSGSWTHALHGKAGATPRDSFSQLNPNTGTTTTYSNLLPLTMLRLNGLASNPVTGSWTHALHGVNSGMLATYGWSEAQKQAFRQQLRNMSATPPSGALHGVAGFFSGVVDGKLKTNHTVQWLQLRQSGTFKSMGALHGKAGSNLRGSASSVNTQGQTTVYNNLLNPTVRRLSALMDNPVLGSHTHALHGTQGKQSSLWAKTGKYATIYTQVKDAMPTSGPKPGALHGMAAPGGASGNILGALQSMLGFGGSSWPIAKFHFYVMVGGTELGFQAVEGLEASVGVIEYRDGNSPFFGKEKVPGLITYEKVTLKKGMFTNDTNANTWFKEIAQDRLYTKRRTIVIALMDNTLVPQFIWRYEQCFLTKVVPSNLDAESESEVAIEELEFVGRAWYLETLAGAAAGLLGTAAGAAGINLSF